MQMAMDGKLVTKLINPVKEFLNQLEMVSNKSPVEFWTTFNTSSDK